MVSNLMFNKSIGGGKGSAPIRTNGVGTNNAKGSPVTGYARAGGLNAPRVDHSTLPKPGPLPAKRPTCATKEAPPSKVQTSLRGRKSD